MAKKQNSAQDNSSSLAPAGERAGVRGLSSLEIQPLTPSPSPLKRGEGSEDSFIARKGEATGQLASYRSFLSELKQRIRTAQIKAALAANAELIQLYWDIGHMIADRQRVEGWGNHVIEQIANDLKREFPGISGFSRTNIFRMRAFFLAYTKSQPDVSARDQAAHNPNVPQAVGQMNSAIVSQPVGQIVSQPVTQISTTEIPAPIAQLPWGHNVILVEKVKQHHARLWYAEQAITNGWSRAILTVQIESNLFDRTGNAVTNFAATLPSPQSDLAQQTLKDPYVFDFLTLKNDAQERDFELGLVEHVQKFLLELGAGFAFVGRQVPMIVGDDDFYLDLVFYHLKLRCFVVIDLKMHKFTPEDAGKLNFYLSAVDSQIRHPDDQPTIGIVLCKTHDRIIVEYALRDINKPIGVAEWQTQLVQSLPEQLRSSLPTIEQIEEELGNTHISMAKGEL